MHYIKWPVLFVLILLSFLPAQTIVTGIQVQPAKNSLLRQLLKKTPLKINQTFNPAQVAATISYFEKKLQAEGYLLARVDSVTRSEPKPNSIEIIFWISPGHQAVIRNLRLTADKIDSLRYRSVSFLKTGQVYNEKQISQQLLDFLHLAADSGYALAQAEIASLAILPGAGQPEVNLHLHIREGEKIRLNHLFLIGNKYTRPTFIQRELRFRSGEIYERREWERFKSRLEKTAVFKTVQGPELIPLNPNTADVLFRLEEGSAASFDGVVGYIPPPTASEDGYLTGLIDVNFNNLFGTGRKFGIFWQKPDKFSEQFRMSYTEPWLMDWPLDVSGSLQRIVRDTTFIEWRNQLQFSFHLNEFLSLQLAGNFRSIIPDSAASAEDHLLRTRTTELQTGLLYDTRNYRPNPNQGILYETRYQAGVKQNLGPEYLLREDSLASNSALHSLLMRFEWYVPVLPRQVISLVLTGSQVRGAVLQKTDFFWFGGARSLRGFREDQFFGSTMAWANLEYRFLTGKNSRLFVFTDGGYFVHPGLEDFLYSYGGGLRIDSPLGILGVDFGLAAGDSFSEGKIHFGLISQF